MQSTSAHYWCVFQSLLNCIAEVCAYLLLLCTVAAVYWGSVLIMNFSTLTQVCMYVCPKSFTCDLYKAHVCVRTPVCSHLCTDCFVFPSRDHVWSVCTALTLVISCECCLFTVEVGVMWWNWHF